ncbi:MAG: peptidoglycan D,D-transpeptidase FtsI family protein [Limisphaerales bacterium]
MLDQLRRGDQRLRMVGIGALCGLAILLVGLWYVQVASHKRFQASLKSQTFRNVRVPGVRGKVMDRQGAILAENRPSYNLNLYLEELRPGFQREYRRLRLDLQASLRSKLATASASERWFDPWWEWFKPKAKAPRLSATQIADLGGAARYAVASNVVNRANALAGETNQLGFRDFARHYRQWPYRPLPVIENLAPPQLARLLETGTGLPGLDIDVQPVRHYPAGQVVAHVLGYLTRDDHTWSDDEEGFSYSLPVYNGAVGVEYAFNEELSGRPGLKSMVVNSLSFRESESVWVSAIPGQNLVLTLDLGLQTAAYNALRTAGADVRGAVVVMDVQNGDVLALVSCPSYDPNEFVAAIAPERWAVLNDAQQRPIFNRATQGAYSPGSIFKIVTALACFDAGLDPDQRYVVEEDPARPGRGAVFVGRRKIEDTVPPGEYDFVRAFKRSSNSYFIHHGLKAGRERLLNYGKALFLGERMGLPTRQEVRGYFPRPDEVLGLWTDGNVANVCIGQEITVTPLQMAVLTAAIANGGRVFSPRLATRVEPAEDGLADAAGREFPSEVRGRVRIPTPVQELIRTAMLADTEEPEGTGFSAFQQLDRATGKITPRLPGFRVGGKTGTAEVKQGGRLVDKITWFVAFGPFESPRYAVVVMVESGGSGGGTCAPVARRVFEHIAQRLRALPGSVTSGLAAVN